MRFARPLKWSNARRFNCHALPDDQRLAKIKLRDERGCCERHDEKKLESLLKLGDGAAQERGSSSLCGYLKFSCCFGERSWPDDEKP
ncbi:MAG: hypothetical protein AB1540_03525 [Bdellovibrionota bacterium]